jgi:tetratricopeptide (TPR) repeat protein
MANDDPDNELGHFRLGQLLMEDLQYEEAIASFQRTLELSPQFSKVYQLLGQCYLRLNEHEQAGKTLTEGYQVADERGDKMPRDEMGRLLASLGLPIPASANATPPSGPETNFRCERPGCRAGKHAQPLTAPPIDGPVGVRIQQVICSDCWNEWFKQMSIKVINELRLDLSTEFGQTEYDKYMNGFFGFEEAPPVTLGH